MGEYDMNRQELIDQIKEEYASIASSPDQNHFHKTTTEMTPEEYYEKLSNAVITEIEKGTFNDCRTSSEIIYKVAADKSILSEWNN